MKEGQRDRAMPCSLWAVSISYGYCALGDPSIGMLSCRTGGGPDSEGRDIDCPGNRESMARVVAVAKVSNVTYPWEGGVSGASRMRIADTEIDSVTGFGGT